MDRAQHYRRIVHMKHVSLRVYIWYWYWYSYWYQVSDPSKNILTLLKRPIAQTRYWV